MGSELTFDFLDDLALAVARRRTDPVVHLKRRRVERLGPFLELLALQRTEILPFNALPLCDIGNTLSSALAQDKGNSGYGSYAEIRNAKIGFVITNRDPNADDQAFWVNFCLKAQEAAELLLPKRIAQGMIGAMREVEENIHLHSERAHDGIVGFRGTPDEFEFVVVDSGIGILESLRKSPGYQHLTDSGSAIKTALADGHSRSSHLNEGRGYGFHDLFVGLANLNGELRFRSGDHALTIDGTSPTLMTARLSQKIELKGFLVNVVCRIKSTPILH